MPGVAAERDANVIGVDVGGTKVAAARIEGARCHCHVEQPTHLESSDGLIDQIESVIREVIDWAGPACPGACPNRGCLEALCSGMALERDATEFAQDHPDTRLGKVLSQSENAKVRGRDVVAAAREKDGDTLELLERLGTY